MAEFRNNIIVCTAGEMIDRLKLDEELDVDDFLMNINIGHSQAELLENLICIAESVMPDFCARPDDGLATPARGEFTRAMRGVASSVSVVTTGGVAGRHDDSAGDRFTDLAVEPDSASLPVVSSAASAFECELIEAIPTCSDLVLSGRVGEMQRHDGQPLIYIDGGYASLSHQRAAGQREETQCRLSALK